MRYADNNIMKTVQIAVEKLLPIVRENKEKHITEYTEAVEDYKAAALILTSNNLKLAKSGELDKIAKIKTLPNAPTSYEQSYTRAIRMLELSNQTIIELEDTVFNQLVLDEWSWKQNFQLSGSLYKSLV